MLALYDAPLAAELLRTWTPERLQQQLEAGQFAGTLGADEQAELHELLHDWVQRALGAVPLRDALLVDAQRGARVYDLIARALTLERQQVPAAAGRMLAAQCERGETLSVAQVRAALAEVAGTDAPGDELEGLLQRAEEPGLALVCYSGQVPRYPFPPDLETLLPPLPPPYRDTPRGFMPPTGWRRGLALALVLLGVAWLGVPLLFGHVLAHPAGVPLAMLTLGLLIGIRAGWPGYCGSFCIWLIPNLPGFHYGTPFATLPAIVPLLLLGLLLLAADQHVRALWRWIALRWRP